MIWWYHYFWKHPYTSKLSKLVKSSGQVSPFWKSGIRSWELALVTLEFFAFKKAAQKFAASWETLGPSCARLEKSLQNCGAQLRCSGCCTTTRLGNTANSTWLYQTWSNMVCLPSMLQCRCDFHFNLFSCEDPLGPGWCCWVTFGHTPSAKNLHALHLVDAVLSCRDQCGGPGVDATDQRGRTKILEKHMLWKKRCRCFCFGRLECSQKLIVVVIFS